MARGRATLLAKLISDPRSTSIIWRGWTDLGGTVRGTPAIAGWTRRSAVFAVRGIPTGNVKVGWRDENGWGGPLAGHRPARRRCASDCPGSWCALRIRAWATEPTVGGGSIGGRNLGGDVQSAPSVAQWRLDRDVHIFVRASDNSVGHLTWSPGSSGHWQSIGGQVDGSPAAVAWGPNRLDVVARDGASLGLLHCSSTGRIGAIQSEVQPPAENALSTTSTRPILRGLFL